MLYALDVRGAQSFALTAAVSEGGLGAAVPLDLVAGVYELRSTGPVMVCHGTRTTDEGLLVTPSTPAPLAVEDGRKLCASSMSGACRLTFIPIVEVRPSGVHDAALPDVDSGSRVVRRVVSSRPTVRT